MSYFHENFGINEVYVEGVDYELEKYNEELSKQSMELERERKQMIGELESQIAYFQENLDKEERFPIMYSDALKKEEYKDYLTRQIENIKRVYADLKNKQEDCERYKKERIIYGAAFVLSDEGKIKILASEDRELNDKSGKRLTDKAENKKIKVEAILHAFEAREDKALEIISRSNNQVALLVYGALHDFKGRQTAGKNYEGKGRVSLTDNIFMHNLNNPDRKFSLIETTPERYHGD